MIEPRADGGRVLSAALAILDQGEQLLEMVPPPIYVAQVPAAFNASIGGHYRHCLDHFISFQRAWDREILDYNTRDRGPHVENDPAFARQLTRQLRAGLEALPAEALSRPIAARAEVSYDAGEPPVTRSTLGRELAYVIAHSIHHYALIAVMAGLAGVGLPSGFGVAPSTLHHQEALSRT